jgi:hypothetical protein
MNPFPKADIEFLEMSVKKILQFEVCEPTGKENDG